MLADLEVGTLSRVLRPTLLCALVAGVLAAGVAVLLGSPLAAVGIVLGVGVAVLNVRMLAAGVSRVDISTAVPDSPAVAAATAPTAAPAGSDAGTQSEAGIGPLRRSGRGPDGGSGSAKGDTKVVRRILRTRSAVRLVAITLLAVGLLLVKPPLGIGMVVGLVIFQIAFVANAGRAVLSAQIV